ncbi:DUF935 family protein, partial [Salmonella enterica subsp. diarizonae]
EGILPPDYKFICPTQDATYDNPYGFADLSMCFWPGMFKKHGWRFWMQFVEKYATPWAVGKHARGATQSDIDQLMDGLEQMVQDAIAVIPEGDSVEIKEPMGKSASSDIFQAMITMARAEISIALLGQNQTTEAETNKASAQAGLEVTDDIRDGDAAIVTGAINQVLQWAAQLNFGDVPVPVWNLWEQESIDDTQAKRDQTLSQTRGFFTEQYYQREYGLQPGDINPQAMMLPSSSWGQMPLTGQSSLTFAEAAARADSDVRDKLDEALSSVSDTLMSDDVMAPLLAPVFEAMRNGVTPTDLMGQLASIYPQMNGDELIERLAKVRFLAKVLGIHYAHG